MLAMLLGTTAIVALSFPYFGLAADPDDARVPGLLGRLRDRADDEAGVKKCRWRQVGPWGD
jgi:hypothetical protein